MNYLAMLLMILLATTTGNSLFAEGRWLAGSFILGCVIFVAMIIMTKAEKEAQKN